MNGQAAMHVVPQPGHGIAVAFSGALDADSLPPIWPRAREAVRGNGAAVTRIDAQRVTYCDGSGIAFLLDLQREGRRQGGQVTIENLDPRFSELLAQFQTCSECAPAAAGPAPRREPLERLGQLVLRLNKRWRLQLKFARRVAASLLVAIRRPSTVRWKDVLDVTQRMGVEGLPVVTLIAFLMGVVLAYQSAVPMRQFGAELFVANLIGLSMMKELAPLMTAVVLAGRTGAAYAAEIGTMKLDEEIDALTTMSLDPLHFLVVPRILATLFITPLLTVYANLLGLLGGGLVMFEFAIPPAGYVHQIIGAVSVSDFIVGLFKSLVFAFLIAAIGCLRGLETSGGARAVGEAATSAVVTTIVAVVVCDGLFAVLFNFLRL